MFLSLVLESIESFVLPAEKTGIRDDSRAFFWILVLSSVSNGIFAVVAYSLGHSLLSVALWLWGTILCGLLSMMLRYLSSMKGLRTLVYIYICVMYFEASCLALLEDANLWSMFCVFPLVPLLGGLYFDYIIGSAASILTILVVLVVGSLRSFNMGLPSPAGLHGHGISVGVGNFLNFSVFCCVCFINFWISVWHRKVLNSSNHEKTVEAKISMMAMLSHDLRQPVHSLSLLTRLMMGSLSDSANQIDRASLQSNLDDMSSVVDHCSCLVDDFLLFSKMSKQADTSLNLEAASLAGILAKVQSICANLCQQTFNKLVIAPLTNLPASCWNVDRKSLTRVLVNLASNGLNYTPAGGSVTLKVFAVENQTSGGDGSKHLLEFQVSDTGCGISAADMKEVFKPFSRGSRDNSAGDSKTDRAGGTGLGLTITLMLVNKMGGDITVDSVLGKGTTFSFRLPLTIVKEESVVESDILFAEWPTVESKFVHIKNDQSLSLHLLLVDDVKLNRSLLHRTLEQFLAKFGVSIKVAFAVNGVDCVEKFKSAFVSAEPFDAVFVDREMPLMNGIKATRLMSEFQKPVLNTQKSAFISLSASAEDNSEWFAAGLTASLGKPFSTADLFTIFCKLQNVARQLSLSPKFEQMQMFIPRRSVG